MGFPGEEIVTALIGGGATLASNAQQQAAQQAAAKVAMDFSHQEAQNQMAFQERMSSTAHQREMQDLKTAGLNPILAAGGGGSSTPGGAAGSGEMAEVKGLGEGVVSNALSAARMSKDIEEAESRIKLNNANADAAKAKAAIPEATKGVIDFIKDAVKNNATKKNPNLLEKILGQNADQAKENEKLKQYPMGLANTKWFWEK